MEKGLRMGAGQCPCQAYWKELLEKIEVSGRAGPVYMVTGCNPMLTDLIPFGSLSL